ncbi:MAG: CYTH domain-containing protein [Candidatus Omnitrophica bacterium]|nr:CYTH domain-containing protein [Candidatus Omnitrophota bacterium]
MRTAIEEEARFVTGSVSVHEAAARLRELGGWRLVSRRRERQRNTYLDTDDLRLLRARSVLKIRQVSQRVEVTLKRSLGFRQGVVRRREITACIRPASLARVVAGKAGITPVRLARRLTGTAPWQPLFTLFTDRRILVFASGRARVEVDVDAVAFRRHGRAAARRYEVEVENLNAPPAAFRKAVAALRRTFGGSLSPTRVSKFEYGLGLARPRRAPRRRARRRGYL